MPEIKPVNSIKSLILDSPISLGCQEAGCGLWKEGWIRDAEERNQTQPEQGEEVREMILKMILLVYCRTELPREAREGGNNNCLEIAVRVLKTGGSIQRN